ncbi:MAG: sigma-70 family RNA polymerase sigma factor [Polyangiaceae bacterium]|nr:sigma-70 family RNA polymerase sigma factor [Polyangiaceae bacterium]
MLFQWRHEDPAASTPVRGAQHALRLRRIFDDTHDLAWRLLRRFGVPPERVEDAVQQVFLITAERLDDILPGSERAFVYGVVLGVSRSIVRRGWREVLGDDSDLRSAGPTEAEALLDRKRLVEECDRILDRLAPELREVFVLHEIEGLSSAEVARLVGIPQGTVSSRLRRARQLFRTEVEALGAVNTSTEVHGG